MKGRRLAAVVVTLLFVFTSLSLVSAQQKTITVGVSWANFQEERWKIDEAAIKAALAKAGARYVSADAQSSNEKQISDVEGLIARGVNALIILAWDKDAVLPAVNKAKAEKIPVIGYDRLIETPGVFYITFDNREVGRMQAREVFKVRPKGNYVFIKGSSTDPNADFVHGGQLDILGAAIKKGDIKVVGEQYTDGWRPEVAQKNMEQILTRTNNKVDAVVSSNDGMAGGVIAALAAVGLAGKVPVSGQDGDIVALNHVAKGNQTVSVWKDARDLGRAAGEVAVALARGTALNKVKGAVKFKGPRGVTMDSILLKPVPIVFGNLDLVIKAKWATKAQVCQGVNPAKAPPACK
ncbi:MAG: D-xylose ABC transporter periplasmic substrate-binding protein [Armatimonadetes bacterium CSP1-3]|nr:MAG: D-xylose ABC transporter periplasmic substrate-binding protein [Armatimonadetes bacterium CSP1-3]